MLGLACLGCARSARPGRIAGACLLGLFGYVLIATYVAKLIPLYGGYAGRTSVASLIALYSGRLPFLIDNLNLVALAPGWSLLTLTAIVTLLAATHMVILIRSLH